MRDQFRDDPELVVGGAVLAAAALIVVMLLSGVVSSPFGGGVKQRTVRATFVSAQQLSVGDDVRVRGITSGTVDSIARAGAGAQVTMKVDRDVGELDDDARATIQYKTVLGGTFFVDLDPGKSGRQLKNAAIPLARTQNQVELDDVLDATKAGAQKGLQILPGEVAQALSGKTDVRDLADTVKDVSPGVRSGVGAVRGAEADRDLQSLVANTARTVEALDSPSDRIRDVVEGGAATLQTTAARDDDIRRTLSLLPASAREADTTLRRVSRTLDVADPLISKLQEPAKDVAPTFAAVRPTLRDADTLLRDASPLLRDLRPAASSLAAASRQALPLFRGLQPAVDRLEKRNLPALLEVDPVTEKLTATMVGGTFSHLGAIAGQMDASGHLIRFPLTSGSASVTSLPCQTYFSNPDSPEVVRCDSFNDALKTFLNYQATGPLPGSADGPSRKKGAK